ncbi:hypothetical protein HanRHA438_Chr17g0831701 [Helianthus annuus]|uniref:Uncharacterized protein n=1 Tax=Helianthus annuus TaxID=4232 RepID=A0A9K3J706_HELAN|nr:hypothetical protein HanXRQr2_Chr14g0660481 [Helianthus annuus]KAF5809968.1 hypothetical protein HanXRQr2_Chr04g0163721 [Helianthus annuus]KAJ0465418.1 hypothetical protein HanHA300_Chr14g0538021 [Helianthus annuus]KAJ0487019.1 hypothetical protein HanHA89_Chr14g0585871 [Helianthus annuus]KAJ0496130.1 hypothetical protein HanHA89_Chr13g0496231 [Helianthus annuus]
MWFEKVNRKGSRHGQNQTEMFREVSTYLVFFCLCMNAFLLNFILFIFFIRYILTLSSLKILLQVKLDYFNLNGSHLFL